MDALPGHATAEGTLAYAAAHRAPAGHFRDGGLRAPGAEGLVLSSLGWGSYLGDVSEAANEAYEEAALYALQHGVNVMDTAANYRDQRSERDLGRALQRFVHQGGDRAGIVVSSKAGFLHGDADSELRGPDWFQQEYVLDSTVGPADIVGNVHCLKPGYLANELDRSLANLGLACLDVFFVHNPETQLAAGVPEDEVLARMEAAFTMCEEARADGKVQVYGVATWDGLRVPPDHPSHLSLVKLMHVAGAAAKAVHGDARRHGFRAVQLPVNLAMPEAAAQATQPLRLRDHVPALAAAKDMGLTVYASASLMQARLRGRVPADVKEALGCDDDLEACLHFTRSMPGVASALVGMGQPAHAQQDVAWAMARGPDGDAVAGLLADAMASAAKPSG